MNRPPPQVGDPNVSQRGAADPSASVWVSASAGTGKTKILTDRVLSLMLTGTPPQRILCLTFTKAAAAEMSMRLAAQLGAWAAADAAALEKQLYAVLGRAAEPEERSLARQLFARVLDTPGGMNIQTIHAFCQSVLGRFPLEAGIAPHFAVLDERDAEELLAAAREEVLSAAGGEAGDVAGALAEVTAHVHEKEFAELMAAVASDRDRLARLIRARGSVDAAVAAIRAVLGLGAGESPESIVAAAAADGAFDALGLHDAVSALEAGSKTDRERGRTIADWLSAAPAERVETFAEYAAAFLTGKDSPQVRKLLITKAAAEAVPGAEEILTGEAERLLAVEMRQRAAITAQATAALLTLSDALLERYRRLKEVRAVLDYDDLIARTGKLLESAGSASWVLYKLDGGIDHLLIDEAQDTSPEQWHIIRALSGEFFAGEGAQAERRTVFAVGDVKQSIFSFQGADPQQFLRNEDWFGERVRAAGGLWRPISMQTSFRSTRAVLAAVDAVFAAPAAAAGVALDGAPIVHQAYRKTDGGMVEVWPPLVPRESDAPSPWKPPIERIPGDSPELRLAHVVARRIAAMTGGEEMLASAGRPIRAGDIMVLVRRRTAFVEELVRTLKDLRVPVAGVDRMVLSEQMAVMDLIALGRFVLLPDDDLTLATVLKSPLIGFDDENLFTIAYHRPGSLWAALRARAEEVPAFAAAAAYLRKVMALADAMPPFEFFARVLGQLGGRRRLLARLGPDAEDPLAEFLDLAVGYERNHTASLQGFLQWLEAGEIEVKRDLEQSAGRDAVRVITVHGAKGLQAPIVFLPDTMSKPTRLAPLLWGEHGNGEVLLWPPRRRYYEARCEQLRESARERQLEEYRRLMYVAMTRAADRLIVCGWQGRRAKAADCWYRLIRGGLLAAAESGREDVEQVEDRFLAADPEADDARILRLTCAQESAPERQHPAPRREVEPLPEWASRPPPAEPQPPQPLVPSRPDEQPPVRSPFGADAGARFKRGRIIHRLLQSLPELPPAARREAARAWLARPIHALDAKAQAEITEEVLAVLADPASAPAFAPGSRSEVPLTGVLPGGQVVSGQVDRLVVTDAAVSVIDYKTDRPPPASPADVPPVYLRQMACYRALLAAMYPDRPVRCWLLWTDGPRLMPLEEAILDPHAPGKAANGRR